MQGGSLAVMTIPTSSASGDQGPFRESAREGIHGLSFIQPDVVKLTACGRAFDPVAGGVGYDELAATRDGCADAGGLTAGPTSSIHDRQPPISRASRVASHLGSIEHARYLREMRPEAGLHESDMHGQLEPQRLISHYVVVRTLTTFGPLTPTRLGSPFPHSAAEDRHGPMDTP